MAIAARRSVRTGDKPVWMPSIQVAAARADRLVFGFDLAATFLFGLRGGEQRRRRPRSVGVLVLGFVTAVGGGIIRDLRIGDVPPAAFRLQRYIVVALLGAAIAFVIFTPISHVPT